MSDKLKIMQEPLTAKAKARLTVSQENMETVFYKFETCEGRSYFIETPSEFGLTHAIERAEEEFALDLDRVYKTERVGFDSSLRANNIRVFVSRI